MLPHTEEEKEHIRKYYLRQSPKAAVTFLQKVYPENVIGHRHDVWDVHASDGRWWVITNPTNLYSQDQFPNLDYAVTFHMGLCVRIPRTQEERRSDFDLRPFTETLDQLRQLAGVLGQAQNVSDCQSIGVRCREALLGFVGAAQDMAEWVEKDAPKRADFRAWVEIICNAILGGQDHKERRHLLKTMLGECWTYSNWLTHARNSSWHDAETARTTVEHAIGSGVGIIVRHIRMVPDACPSCSSPRLLPEKGVRTDGPDVLWERPVRDACGWTGTPVVVRDLDPEEADLITREGGDETNGCIVPDVPLHELERPDDDK